MSNIAMKAIPWRWHDQVFRVLGSCAWRWYCGEMSKAAFSYGIFSWNSSCLKNKWTGAGGRGHALLCFASVKFFARPSWVSRLSGLQMGIQGYFEGWSRKRVCLSSPKPLKTSAISPKGASARIRSCLEQKNCEIKITVCILHRQKEPRLLP